MQQKPYTLSESRLLPLSEIEVVQHDIGWHEYPDYGFDGRWFKGQPAPQGKTFVRERHVKDGPLFQIRFADAMATIRMLG